MSWNDERVEHLKKMWNDGQSASQIAKELGGITRNAVIGKVHRLGLSNRPVAPASEETGESGGEPEAEPQAAAEEPAADEPAAAEAEAEVEPAPEPESPPVRTVVAAGQPLPPQPSANEVSEEALASVREAEKKARHLGLMDLTERTCKWPIGDPATDDFSFCGLAVKPGKPYCEAHVEVAFQPMSSRRDRKR